MDKDEIELLKKLLSNEEVKETLKKILLEDNTEKVAKNTNSTTAKKRGRPKKQVVENNTKEDFKTKKVEDKYTKKIFVDDLSEAIFEEINGKKVNLITESKRISKTKKPKPKRQRVSLPKSTCSSCKKQFDGVGYLCNSCLSGKGKN